MKIYTKTGDKGQTSLFDGTRVSKNHIRVETYGTIDELNSVIGVVLSELNNATVKTAHLKRELQHIQRDLFDIGSFLANPSTPDYEPSTISYFEDRIQAFEKLIDTLTEKLPALTNFILPGGGKAGSQLHVARTIARRVERRVIELMQKEKVEIIIVKYINRLSDLLYTMSRYVNHIEQHKEVIWRKQTA